MTVGCESSVSRTLAGLCGALVFLLIQGATVDARSTHQGENEVIVDPGVSLPVVPPDVLEAYYYKAYAGESHLDLSNYGRPGNATMTSSCTNVRAVPEELRSFSSMRPQGISAYYTKYTEAYGIPVLATSSIPDQALHRACYVLRFLLADRQDLRQEYYKYHGRVAIIPHNSSIKSIPEYNHIHPDFSLSTRGLGAIPAAPVSSAGEENILCYEDDDYSEDILIREIALGIFQLAARRSVDGIRQHLENIYNVALESGWWDNTYAEHTPSSYFGEGVQSFFNVNAYADPADGYHNDINTRSKLRSYDTSLSNFVQSLFPCANNYIKRCSSRGNEAYQQLRMNCPRRPVTRFRTRHTRRMLW